MSSSEDEAGSDDSQAAKKGKLKSGKCAKVDNTDIKKVVSYPHSKLNREFVRYTSFDDLPLNIFAAGELELILRAKSDAERLARTNILLMCMYHSQYLDISEIRDQYDVLLKSIERGEYHWVDNLGDRIDRALDRRARVVERENVRTKIRNSSSTNNKSNPKKAEVGNNKNRRSEAEFIYCLDFNKGVCNEVTSHLGRFAGRDNVMKHHICRKCWSEKGNKVGHPEIDDRCPLKRQ